MEIDEHFVQESLRLSAESVRTRVPPRYAEAQATHPDVVAWVRSLIEHVSAVPRRGLGPAFTVGVQGPSLFMLGDTGTGKTYQAWGAVRALAGSGVRLTRWEFSTAADLYARMRPRQGVDPESVFERHAHAPLLVIDDLGAAKGSDWNEEINYRLVNHRYERRLPTLVITNVRPSDLKDLLGDRVTSRLREMAHRVVLTGGDRRKPPGVALPAPLVAPLPDEPAPVGVPMPDHVREGLARLLGRNRVADAYARDAAHDDDTTED